MAHSLNMTCPTGQSYTAKLDGTDAPYKGDPGIDAVSITLLSKETFVETDKRNGKAVKTKRVTAIPAGGNTLNLIVGDLLRGTSTLYVADKQ
jgi:hypothetical protein